MEVHEKKWKTQEIKKEIEVNEEKLPFKIKEENELEEEMDLVTTNTETDCHDIPPLCFEEAEDRVSNEFPQNSFIYRREIFEDPALSDGPQMIDRRMTVLDNIFYQKSKETHSLEIYNKNISNTSSTLFQQVSNSVEEPFLCDICSKSYRTEDLLRSHKMTHLDEKPLVCKICLKIFMGKDELKHHVILCHYNEREIFSSEYIYKKDIFNNSCTTYPQITSQSNEGGFLCDHCGKTFTTEDHLRSHKMTHSEEEQLEGEINGKMFMREDELRQHVIGHYIEKQICSPENIIKNSFNESSTSYQQIISDSNEGSFLCDLCGKTFVAEDHLRSHKMIHCNEKPLKCEICGQNFTKKKKLKQHVKSHYNEKLFMCKICEKFFPTKRVLKQHLLTHSTEGPFACKLCNTSFKEVSHLSRHNCQHMAINSNENQFVCEVCKMCFNHEINLKRHCHFHMPAPIASAKETTEQVQHSKMLEIPKLPESAASLQPPSYIQHMTSHNEMEEMTPPSYIQHMTSHNEMEEMTRINVVPCAAYIQMLKQKSKSTNSLLTLPNQSKQQNCGPSINISQALSKNLKNSQHHLHRRLSDINDLNFHTNAVDVNIMSDDELVSLSVRELNKKLDKLPKDIQNKIRRKRRTLKNRKYAQICRMKRQSKLRKLQGIKIQLQFSQAEVIRLYRQVENLVAANENLKKELETLKKQNKLDNSKD